MAPVGMAAATDSIQVPAPPGFHRLFDEYADTVFLTALRVTGNREDAEDVVQTVFLRIWGNPDRLDPDRGAGAYLRRAATNAAVDILRKRSSSKESPMEDTVQFAAPRQSPLLKARLRQAIARLDPQDAELFLLRNIEGFTLPELAEMLGMERSTVGTRLFRIRQFLQREIER